MHKQDISIIYTKSNLSDNTNWQVINDGVMGGLSEGYVGSSETGNTIFKGFVSTDNYGGFSSIKYTSNKRGISVFKYLVLIVKGDGKCYQFRIKDDISHRYSYVKTFKTSGVCETIKIPLNDFYPTFRGKKLDMPNFSGDTMEEIGFLIGNKTKESFSLEIESIFLEA
ncbi:MAG: CIA30 family protein [Flaviramulus sp.]|nr:CIA30 family protein [Flaviramulus sp.]